MGIAAAGLWIATPIIGVVLYYLFKFPKLSIYLVFMIGFALPIFGRYVPGGIPFGLTIDVLLVFTFFILMFRETDSLDLSRANHWTVWLMVAWMAYIGLELFNPNAYSMAAWFYSMRGIALYQLLIMVLIFKLFNVQKDLKRVLYLWLAWSVLGIVWGIKQKYLGVSSAEQAWLDGGEYVTHILFGKLRVFSYYFDAGTFGAAMGHVMTATGVLALGPYSMKKRIVFGIITLFAFYALMISGTRGALAVPGIGFFTYLVLTKNIKILSLGLITFGLAFSFLKFTTIGNNNYDINRLRTALDPNDASLNTRLRNRARLSVYLQGKPLGGGVGTTGSWGKRFSPGTWLAEFEPDGLYTRIRAETGLLGRNFYVGIWLAILFVGIRRIWRIENPEYKNIAMAFWAGYGGILMANYGNQVMTQYPINLTVFVSIPLVFMIPVKPKKGKEESEESEQ